MIHCFWNLISLPQVRESLMELDSIRADVQQNLAVMPRSYGQARNPTLPIALYDLVCCRVHDDSESDNELNMYLLPGTCRKYPCQ
jgi:hypothetical protein